MKQKTAFYKPIKSRVHDRVHGWYNDWQEMTDRK